MRNTKKIIAVLLTISMLASMCIIGAYAEETPPDEIIHPEGDTIISGDMNFDGHITIDDVTQYQRLLANRSSIDTSNLNGVTLEDMFDLNSETDKTDDKSNGITIEDATMLQCYIAEYDDADYSGIGKPIAKWEDAEYETTSHPAVTETKTVVVKPAEDVNEMVIDKETITIKRPIYKSGYDCICNDCDMVMRWDNGKAYTSTEILAHLNSHTNTNQLPVTREGYLARYYVDAYGQQCPVGPGYSVWVSFKDENGNLYSKSMPYDESLPLYHGNGSNGSYRYTYTTNIPTGEYEEIEVPAKVPVYTSGEAYVATATGEVLYHADGVAWTPSEFGWFIERRAQEGYDNGLTGQELKDYTGIIEKQWTDKIPTGEFTDQPLEGCYHYEMVHHDAVTENVTEVITPAYTEEKLTKPAGYYPITK